MNEADIHQCALKIVEGISLEFPDMDPRDAIMAIFGAALMTGRTIGIEDHDLHQGFGAFLEDNAA